MSAPDLSLSSVSSLAHTPKGRNEAPLPSTLAVADVFETHDNSAVIIELDVPGISKRSMKVRVNDGCVHVSGVRQQDSLAKDAHFLHSERTHGQFSRFFRLPEACDVLGVTAHCDRGVLTIRVPKTVAACSAGPTDKRALASVAAPDPAAEGDGSLNDEFAALPIRMFPTPAIGKLVTIDSDLSIAEAVKVLARYRILAAPVRDVRAAPDAPWTAKYMGFLDMASVVNYMLDKLEPTGRAPQDFEAEIEAVEEFHRTTVADLADVIHLLMFVPIEHDRGSLLDAMLLCGQHGIRRVPVVKSPGGDIVNIITQSALVQTLAANLDKVQAVGHLTIRDLGFGTPGRVYSVSTADPLRAAFQLIKQYDISAVPVLDDKTNEIRGNISARDVRLIATSKKVYSLLNMPIRVYLDVVSDGAENSAITCTPDDTMEDVIKRLVRSRIHRIYVVDEKMLVTRVVSLRDILRKFVKESPNYFGHYFD